MTPESKTKDNVKRFLKALHAYWHMPVQNGMGSPALDFHVCIPVIITPEMVGKTVGLYVGIEAKAAGKTATPRQERTMEEIRAAGGLAFVVDDQPTEIASWVMNTMKG